MQIHNCTFAVIMFWLDDYFCFHLVVIQSPRTFVCIIHFSFRLEFIAIYNILCSVAIVHSDLSEIVYWEYIYIIQFSKEK